ncbi:hypothetical protein I302_103539 [Kwoniella bestiolae CBS 10118]|uniref:DUF7704 domain-containing protein n=1 Tax=Kwoniella bestiolae CBS 10118 TaxID=1296100 RepID=A0A1B9G8P0_9TREE|nr:hypothetical protein I302_02240 [Kwoniella bestiolae CBS 10118]OCF27398.1 hypothetical protein I302_02240 [Kwoniella bestiolae CBS 10118]
MRSVLPAKYYYFFWVVESVLTIAGGLSAIINPEDFGRYQLSDSIERLTVGIGGSSRGQMVISQLGSCFILLAMISLSLVYLFKKHLDDRPALLEKMMKGLLVPLAIADLLHVFVTLIPLPISHLKSPSEWTHIIHCTVWITLTLFMTRVCWLVGIGRPSARSLSVARPSSPLSKTGQRRIPLPKTDSELVIEQVVPKEAEAEGARRRNTPRKTRLVE